MIETSDNAFRFLKFSHIAEDEELHSLLSLDTNTAPSVIKKDLIEQRLISLRNSGIIFMAPVAGNHQEDILIFLNSPRGRSAYQSIQNGDFSHYKDPIESSEWLVGKPTIFSVYEDNMGPLTPIIADELKDAETAYPEEWIREAIALAVKRNKRSWNYVESILRKWKQSGREESKSTASNKEDYKRYLKDEFSEFYKK